MRDMYTNKITTPEHWYMLMQPTRYSKEDLDYDLLVGANTTVTPSYDIHCIDDVTAGCEPIEIISGERLVDVENGYTEGRKIAKVLESRTGIEDWLIPEDAWECIWSELVVHKKGVKTFIDRKGIAERDYNFSTEMLNGMIDELDRMIIKYNGSSWSNKPTANTLVELLKEHMVLLKEELAEVETGVRKLSKDDFLGPKTRKAMFSEK